MSVELFTHRDDRRPGEPEWSWSRRIAAAELLAEADLPSVDLEEWRYSRIGDLAPERFTLLTPGPAEQGPPPPPVAELLDRLGPLAGAVVVHDGAVVHQHLEPDAVAAGVRFGPAAEEDAEVVGAAMREPTDVFALANDARCDPVVVDVPRRVTVEHPLAIVHRVDAVGAAVHPRSSVRIGEDAECSVIEVFTSGDVEALLVPVTEIAVAAAARARYAVVQDVGRSVWQVGSLVASVARDASLRAGVAALGGDYARLRIDCRLEGRGADGQLSSVYFGDGDQMLDLRTFQDHDAADTTSKLLFKGAVADRSHAVYTGLIRIRPDARGANAEQTNRNLKLSEEAWAESVPNLEIENNDVRCSHASTVGPVDEDQLFYLESRGVPTPVAERLIVGGFFDEVVDALPVPALAPLVTERLDELLDAQLGRVDA